MKATPFIILVVLAAAMAVAGPLVTYELSATTGVGTTNSVSATLPRVAVGYIDKVTVDVVTGVSTSDVQLVITAPDSTIADETVLSLSAVTADGHYRPVVSAQNSTGTVSTLTEPRPLIVSGGYGLKLILTNATAASKVYRTLVTIEKCDQ